MDLNEQSHDEPGVALDLSLQDDDILKLIKDPVITSEDYWENTFGLKNAREDNMGMWLPKHWEDKTVYDYQEDSLYEDPRVFVSTETIVSTVNARIPQVEVMPAQDTITSLQLAKDMQKTAQAYTKRYNVIDLFRLSVRNLMIKRIAYIKLRFDENKGKNGEIVSEFVPAEDVITDKDARYGEIPRFQAHKIRNKTVEELVSMFPDSEQKILKLIGASRVDKKGNRVMYKTMLAKKLQLYEVWFKYLEDNETKSGVALVDENFQEVLDKIPNPNWNYEEEDDSVSNLLDEPAPPFIPINYLNDGTSYIDQTTLIEQAASMQRILDKRGFQIMENADQAGGGLVFNTNMIKKSDISKLSGSPDERIGVKGNVRDAVVRVQPPPLPNYVIEDKMDARNEIDNIFATHDISRGERSKNQTLGQDVMQQQQDVTRMDDIARAVEGMATRYYRYLFQMMKVYYTEDHYFKAQGEDGQFDFVVMRSDLIEDGVDIEVSAGSMMPINKQSQQKWVGDLLGAGMIDPLTVYEVMSGGYLPSPQKMLERFMLFKTDPFTFMGKVKEDDFSREALLDIQSLIRGEAPELRDEYKPEYLKFMNNYMLGGEFEKREDVIKQLFVEHLRMVQGVMSKQLANEMSQMPTQDEMDAQNRQTAEAAQMDAQINQGQPMPEEGGDPRAQDQQAALAQRKQQPEPSAETPVV